MAEEKKTSDVAEKKTDKKVEKKAPAKPKKKSKKNPFKSIASFFKSVKSEGKKVVWAKPADVVRNTIIVLIVCVIVGVCIYLVDTGLSYGMKGIKSLADKHEASVSEQVEETEDEGSLIIDQPQETEAETQAAE